MRTSWKSLCLLAVVVLPLTGCIDAERKFGRGVNNITEFTRLGEIQRSVEQSTLFSGPDGPAVGRTRGFIHGVNRSLARTAIGAFEVLTFPIPTDPFIKPEHPVYPDTYRPGVSDGPTMNTDMNLGFSGGDIFPIFPGSRFKVFD